MLDVLFASRRCLRSTQRSRWTIIVKDLGSVSFLKQTSLRCLVNAVEQTYHI